MKSASGDGLDRLLDEQVGRVFFADDAFRTPDELVEGPSSSTIRRQLDDGRSYRLVKVPHRPQDLEDQLRRLGWRITVSATAGPFYWGAGTRGLRGPGRRRAGRPSRY